MRDCNKCNYTRGILPTRVSLKASNLAPYRRVFGDLNAGETAGRFGVIRAGSWSCFRKGTARDEKKILWTDFFM